jgi:hypothetical protein
LIENRSRTKLAGFEPQTETEQEAPDWQQGDEKAVTAKRDSHTKEQGNHGCAKEFESHFIVS